MLRLAVELADLPPDSNVRERWVQEAIHDLWGDDESRRHLSHLLLTETAPLTRAALKSAGGYEPANLETLSPRIQQVLRGLLTGQSEKQVALDLGISAHTVNGYVKTLHRHFSVNSRGELMALFVPENLLESLSG